MVQFTVGQVAKAAKLLLQPYALGENDNKPYQLLVLLKKGCGKCKVSLAQLNKIEPKLTSLDVTVVYESEADWKNNLNHPWVSAWQPELFEAFYV